MLPRIYHRILAWFATRAGLHLLTPPGLKAMRTYAYYDGWHDAEARLGAECGRKYL